MVSSRSSICRTVATRFVSHRRRITSRRLSVVHGKSSTTTSWCRFGPPTSMSTNRLGRSLHGFNSLIFHSTTSMTWPFLALLVTWERRCELMWPLLTASVLATRERVLRLIYLDLSFESMNLLAPNSKWSMKVLKTSEWNVAFMAMFKLDARLSTLHRVMGSHSKNWRLLSRRISFLVNGCGRNAGNFVNLHFPLLRRPPATVSLSLLDPVLPPLPGWKLLTTLFPSLPAQKTTSKGTKAAPKPHKPVPAPPIAPAKSKQRPRQAASKSTTPNIIPSLAISSVSGVIPSLRKRQGRRRKDSTSLALGDNIPQFPATNWKGSFPDSSSASHFNMSVSTDQLPIFSPSTLPEGISLQDLSCNISLKLNR
ncbi:hypothetical protein LINGRAHAP2_LOCUS31003 [Linum grandiflorum]